MVTVDDRAGSRELLEPLQAAGVPCELGRLDAGDVEIVGNGPDARPVLVGVEVKTLSELLTAIQTGRLAEQARAMAGGYEYRHLLVYGFTSVGDQGELLTMVGRRWEPAGFGTRRMTWVGFHGALHTLQVQLGLVATVVSTKQQAVWWLKALYYWWCCKEWEQHRSHLTFQQPQVAEFTSFRKFPLRRYVAAVMPGVGPAKLDAIEARFATTKDLVNAGVVEWAEIEGVGKVTAKRIVDAVGRE